MNQFLTESEAEYFANAVYAFLGLLSEKFSTEQIKALLTPEKVERYLMALGEDETNEG